MTSLSRRSVLAAGSAAALVSVVAGCAEDGPRRSEVSRRPKRTRRPGASDTTSRRPSQQPSGEPTDVPDPTEPTAGAGVVLGLTAYGWEFADREGLDLGLRRSYGGWWSLDTELVAIAQDHAADRLPWVSFKPPDDPVGAWPAIAAGEHDEDVRARARAYAELAKPVVVTFNHEPHTDSGSAGDWAQAWARVHDVMADETGLANVISVPVVGEWMFNPANEKFSAGSYVTPAVLERMAFLGVDLYQNSGGAAYDVRLGRVLDWLDGQGYPDVGVGVGETGCSDSFGSPSAAEWWTNSWEYAVASRRVLAICYFNSLRNNRAGRNWLLTESAAKQAAFVASARSPQAGRWW